MVAWIAKWPTSQQAGLKVVNFYALSHQNKHFFHTIFRQAADRLTYACVSILVFACLLTIYGILTLYIYI